MDRKFQGVTTEQVFEMVSKSEPSKYLLFALPTSPHRFADYLAKKLGLKRSTTVDDALFFQTTFNDLKEAREFVADYFTKDGHWQEITLGIYHDGMLLWEGMKK